MVKVLKLYIVALTLSIVADYLDLPWCGNSTWQNEDCNTKYQGRQSGF